jgi:hypothetical protein
MECRALLATLTLCSLAALTACAGSGGSTLAPSVEATAASSAALRIGANAASPIVLSFSAACGSKCGGKADAVGYYEHFHGLDPRFDTVTPQEAGYAGGFCVVAATPQGNAPMNNGDPGQVRNDGEFFTVMDDAPAAQDSSIDFIGDDAFPNAPFARDASYRNSVYAFEGALPVNPSTGIETVLHISDAAGCQGGRNGHYARLTINWYRM